jgi:hypothetical protein
VPKKFDDEEIEMTIDEALEAANSEHVVFFLLTAYVETLHYYEQTRAAFPPRVLRLPLKSEADVAGRLRALHDTAKKHGGESAVLSLIMKEAVEVFTAASQRLAVLAAHTRKSRHVPCDPRSAVRRIPEPQVSAVSAVAREGGAGELGRKSGRGLFSYRPDTRLIST